MEEKVRRTTLGKRVHEKSRFASCGFVTNMYCGYIFFGKIGLDI
jgi:hypothetical protein